MVENSVAVLLLLNLVPVYGQLGPFINPPERPEGSSPDARTDPVYAVGNSLNITWTPVNGTVGLAIWQSRPNGSDIGGSQYLPDSESLDKSYYVWDPIGVNGDDNQPNLDLAASNVFHFDLYEDGATYAFGMSMWFNLTSDTINAQGSVISTATSSVSLPASTVRSSTTTTSSHTSSPTSSPTTSPILSPSPSHASTGLSSGAKAGIGVGVAVGALLMIAGIVGAFLLNRRKRNARMNGEETAQPYTDNPSTTKVRPEFKAEMDGTTPQQKTMGSPTVEIDGSPQPVELPSHRYD